MSEKEKCKVFTNFYYYLYKEIGYEVKRDSGEELKPYKKYEPEFLRMFCLKWKDEKDILDQMAKLLSKLITIQALPNANHRTAFRFIHLYLKSTTAGEMKNWDQAIKTYMPFYEKSKYIIGRDINHNYLFNEKYFDVHHYMGIEEHLKHSKKLIKKIVEIQSGIREAVPFHEFITSLNQDGSS